MQTAEHRIGPFLPPTTQKSSFQRIERLLTEQQHASVSSFLDAPGWKFGWKSSPNTDLFSFWHKHFAGTLKPDHQTLKHHETPYDCAEELSKTAPILFKFWSHFRDRFWAGHTLVRCYANAYPYGSDGSVHTDSMADNCYTSIYYPHKRWSPNWGGETIFFNKEETDVIAVSYPKPNSMIMFDGRIPHVGRGVSRMCPVLRITLMFKTEFHG